MTARPFILFRMSSPNSAPSTVMDPAVRAMVGRLHAAPGRTVLAVAGGGAEAIGWLLAVPGASRTVLEAVVPYAPKALADLLGYYPVQSVGEQTAMDMARTAYRRATRLREGYIPVVGIGCTAAISTDRPRKGEHRCHVAAWNETARVCHSLTFIKALRDRAGEEALVSRLVLRTLAESSGIDTDLSLDLDAGERIESSVVSYSDAIEALVSDHVDTVAIGPNGQAADDVVGQAVLPGSFNPFHKGHERLAEVASEILETEVTLELSVTNVDKPPLGEAEVRRRVAPLSVRYPVMLTRAPRFYQKAKLFPGSTFVIGRDTAVRLVDPKYYDEAESGVTGALADIKRLGCRFLVAGRVDNGVFRTLDQISVPDGFADMFTSIPESSFRYDMSSTDLRAATRTGPVA